MSASPPMPSSRRIASLAARRCLCVACGWLLLLLCLRPAVAAVTVNSVTLTYSGQSNQSSVTVPAGASISVTISVTITGSGGTNRWRSTGWSVGSVSGCYDNPNHDSAGTYSETFNVTAPSSDGDYDASFTIDRNPCGGGGAAATSSLPSGIKVDSGSPTATIACTTPAACGPSNPTAASSLTWTVTFSESVSGVDAGDFSLAATGSASASIGTVSGSGTTWTVTATSVAGAGTLQLNLVDNDSITDTAGNRLGGSGSGNGNVTGPSYTVDRRGPLATLTCVDPCGAGNPTSATTLRWTVSFDEDVTGVDLADFALATAGTSGTLASVSGSGRSYTVTVNGASGSGTLGLNLLDDGSIKDSLGNALGDPGSGAVTGPSYTLNQVSVGSFNAYDAGASSLYTKLVGGGFSFDVVALQPDGTTATTFVGNVAVELVDGRSGSCASYAQIADLGTLTFALSDNGRKSVPSTTINNAWRNVRVRMTHTASGTTTQACSTDRFSIRPQSFSVSSSANADASGASGTATPIVVTHAAFTVTANAGVSGYDGTPSVTLSAIGAHTGAVATGTLSGSFASASSGSASGSFAYSEVGYFRFNSGAVYDDSFTAEDQSGDCTNDFSNTAVGGRFGCKFGNTAVSDYFGRFVPHHFDVMVTPSCGPSGTQWTYSGQPMVVTVVARNNASPSAQTTQNYQGVFARDTTLSNDAGSTTGFSNNTLAAARYTAGIGSTPAISDSTALIYRFASAPQTPTTLKIRAVASEGASSAGHTEGSVEMRSGRLRLLNVVGSAQAPLSMPVRVESFQVIGTGGNGWNLQSSDNCTAGVLSSSTFSVSGVATITGFSLSAATGSLTLSPSGAGNADVSGTLNAVASWLKFDWNGDGVADNPSARAAFELKAGSDKQIFRY